MGEAIDSPSCMSSSESSDVDYMGRWEGKMAPVKGFWRLPAEIRNAIYEELLVTDCAFRLGHHGPYSHEKRKTLHPEILRSCSQAYHEAVAILYGSNTFFLGPLGFKPTYSASFLTSIGTHNALRIRTIVAHCIHPEMLTRTFLNRWFVNLGLDFPSLKIIAVSFSTPHDDHKPRIISIPPPPTQFHIPTNLPPVLGSHWPATANVTPATTPPPVASATQQPGSGLLSVNSGHAQGQGHVRVDSAREEVVPETELDRATSRNKGWLEKRKRCEVENLVALRNTDLRAGEEWLVYVSPAVKKRMGCKIW